MNKSELLENYTKEQLAEMAVKLDIASEMSAKWSYNLQSKINDLEEENGRLQTKLDTYNKFLLPRCTKEAKKLIDNNNFGGVRIVTLGQWNNRGRENMNISDIQKHQEEYEKFLKESPFRSEIDKICKDIVEQKNNAMAMEFTRAICDLLRANGVYVHCTETKFSEKITENSIEEKYGILFDSMDFSEHDKVFTDEIEKLKQELCRKETTINQIGNILNELFDVTHDIVETPNKFKEILKQKVESYNTIADYLCDEPIAVASTLISARRSYALTDEEKKRSGLDRGYYLIFDVSELRQIAEHLLVYCNANEREEK